MGTTSVIPASSNTQTSSTQSSNSSNNIFGNDNTQTFLQLLTTELQNQDPTSPMEVRAPTAGRPINSTRICPGECNGSRDASQV